LGSIRDDNKTNDKPRPLQGGDEVRVTSSHRKLFKLFPPTFSWGQKPPRLRSVPVIKRLGNIIISFPDEKIMEKVLKEANVSPDELKDVGENEND
jgi:hypothetical protein